MYTHSPTHTHTHTQQAAEVTDNFHLLTCMHADEFELKEMLDTSPRAAAPLLSHLNPVWSNASS